MVVLNHRYLDIGYDNFNYVGKIYLQMFRFSDNLKQNTLFCVPLSKPLAVKLSSSYTKLLKATFIIN